MSSINISYNPNSYLITRFVSLTWEGIKTTPSIPHEKNIIESLGDGILSVPEKLPRLIRRTCTNPSVLTAALFAAAHLSNTYAFYPEQTKEGFKKIASYLPEITEEMIRFAGWLTTSSLITGVCARIGGRLTPAYCDKLSMPVPTVQNQLTNKMVK